MESHPWKCSENERQCALATCGIGGKAGLVLESFSSFNDLLFLWKSCRSYVGWRRVWVLGGQIQVDKAWGILWEWGLADYCPATRSLLLPPGCPQLCLGWSFTGNPTREAAALLLLQELFSWIPGESRFQTGPSWTAQPRCVSSSQHLRLAGLLAGRDQRRAGTKLGGCFNSASLPECWNHCWLPLLGLWDLSSGWSRDLRWA